MRIIVHDFAGHPFQVQLSRELARRGHTVQHLYLSELQGPKGALDYRRDDAANLCITGVKLPSPIDKYSPIRRALAHRRYAGALIERLAASAPDVVLSANTPIDVQRALLGACRKRGIGFVHWMQDLYCLAIRKVLAAKFGGPARLLAAPYERMEDHVCRHSDGVVFIAEEFEQYFQARRVRPQRCRVIHNWAPLEECYPRQFTSSWRREMIPPVETVLLYSGTLGLKHKPELLAHLAERLRPEAAGARVVAITEGYGREYLERYRAANPLPNLELMDFQPYDRLPDILQGADVLLAILDRESGRFAVPSKILTYLCAGRPVLLAAPMENLAARTIRESGAGVVVDPDSPEEFAAAALALCTDSSLRRRMGEAGQRYARSRFEIRKIGDQFEDLFYEALGTPEGFRPRAMAQSGD